MNRVLSQSGEDGFTVIEALIAMAILAISAVALIGVSEAQVGRIDGLETRAIGLWIAENRLVELELLGSSAATDKESVTMLGRDFDVSLAFAETSDPDLLEVRIGVAEAGRAGPVSALGGFIDASVGRP